MLIVLGILAFLFVLLPLFAVQETWALSRLSSPANATIVKSETRRAGRGWAPVIEYRYTVAGQAVTSARIFPGMLGNWLGWTGAEQLPAAFPVGQVVPIWYDPEEPARAALLRGWFVLPVALPVFCWGGVLSRKQHRRWRRTLGWAMQVWGAGMLVWFRDVIPLDQAGLCIAALLGTWLVTACVSLLRERRGATAHTSV